MRIDTAAMISGTRARNDAKTKINTARAPTAPNSVSTRTLGPSVSPPAASRLYDVSPGSRPAAAAASVSTGSSWASKPGPKPVGSGPCTSAKVLLPSSVTNRSSPVLARSTTRACGSAERTASKTPATSASRSATVLPSGTVRTGTKVSAVLDPKVSIRSCSAS